MSKDWFDTARENLRENPPEPPIDWQARCGKAERDRDHWKETETQSYALYVQVRDELAAIKGRREWGVRILSGFDGGKEISGYSQEMARNAESSDPNIQAIHRHLAGSWEPSEPNVETKV